MGTLETEEYIKEILGINKRKIELTNLLIKKKLINKKMNKGWIKGWKDEWMNEKMNKGWMKE